MFTKYPELVKKRIDFTKLFENQGKYNKVTDFPKDQKVNNHNIIRVCDCGSDNLVEDFSEGAIICTKCGQILEEILDENPEWKFYDDSDIKNARCGAQISCMLPQSSMSTTIGYKAGFRMKNIQNWHAMPSKERSLNNEFKKIHNICQKLDVMKCIEDDAQIMYKMVSECKHKTGKNEGKYVITRGKNRTSILAACLYFACAKKGMIYTPTEIAENFGVKYSVMNKGIKKLKKMIDAKQIIITNEIETPNQFIKRYCDNLKMFNVYTNEAIKISTNVEKLSIATDHNPYSVAGACIWIIVEKYKINHVTKKKLADEFGISDVTISKAHKKIESYIDILFDDSAVEKLHSKCQKSAENNTIPEEIMEKMKQFGVMTTSV